MEVDAVVVAEVMEVVEAVRGCPVCRYFFTLGKCHFFDIWPFLSGKCRKMFNYFRQMSLTKCRKTSTHRASARR